MSDKPLVSVVMPVYNRSHTVAEAIGTVLQQSYKNFEFIIVNDGSTDSTWELLGYYAKKDPRVKVINLKVNQGISNARNTGIEASKGEYIAVMDSDDWALPYRLEFSVKAMKPGIDGVYSSYIQSTELGDPISPVEPKEFKDITLDGVLKYQEIPHVTLMARRECFIKYPYRKKFKYNDDHALILDFFVYGKYNLKKIKDPLMGVRYHGQSTTTTKTKEIEQEKKLLEDEFKPKETQ